MKAILKLILILIFFNCKAQVITPLYNDGTTPYDGIQPSRYYKDVDNDFNPYVGTWKWQDGNNSLTIIFNKITNHFSGGQSYNDLLVGEYQYVENGNMLVNSYPSLMFNNSDGIPNIINTTDPWVNNIVSISIKTENRGFPPCPECAPNTRFIILGISDPTRPNVNGGIKMARFIENGIEKIRMRIYTTYYEGDVLLTIPKNSIWTLTKVN